MSNKHFLARARVDRLMDDRSSSNIVWGERRSRNYKRVVNLELPDPARVPFPLKRLPVEIMQNGIQRQHGQEEMRWGSRQRTTVNQENNDCRGMRWGSKRRRRTVSKADPKQGERVYEETVTQNNSPPTDLTPIGLGQHGKEEMKWGSKKRRTIINVDPQQQILEGERANEETWNQESNAAESLLMLKNLNNSNP